MVTLDFLQSLSRKTPNEIQDYQLQQAKKAVQYAAQHSPFYKKHFQNHGINPLEIESWADFRKIPPISKSEMQGRNEEFWCVGSDKIIDYVTTSGTLGTPTTIVLSENDLQRLALNEACSFITAGCRSEDIFQLTTTIDRRFMAGLAYFEGARMLKAGTVRVGPGAAELQWETIQRIRPSVLIAVPSFIVKMLDFAAQNNIEPNKTSVKKAICIGEGIRNSDFSLNVLGKKITSAWNIQLHSTYASTEMATAYTECDHRCGCHENPGLIFTEILDEHQHPVKPGEFGELVFTNFGVEAMPFVRFRTGDIVKAYHEKCACGRESLRISPVEGRLNQMVKYKGTTLFPQAIVEVLNEMAGVKDFRIELKKSTLDTDSIVVYFHSLNFNPQELIQEMESKFKARLRVIPEIVFEKPEDLSAKKYPEGSRKPLLILDLR